MPLHYTWSVNSPFGGLFPDYGQIAHLLRTRAPVAIKSIATLMLPLDLHVLGLSLAFILSQDQTLRCIKKYPMPRTSNLLCTKLTGTCYNNSLILLFPNLVLHYCFQSLKDHSFQSAWTPQALCHFVGSFSVEREIGCKITAFLRRDQIFLHFFWKNFVSHCKSVSAIFAISRLSSSDRGWKK